MAHRLLATVVVAEFTNGENDPDWEYGQSHARRIDLGEFPNQQRAEREARRIQLVPIDETRYVPRHQIKIFEIIEE